MVIVVLSRFIDLDKSSLHNTNCHTDIRICCEVADRFVRKYSTCLQMEQF
jgi:hypothetical protein